MPANIRIAIADDHPVVRSGLRAAIEKEPGLEVVAEAGDGMEAVQMARKLQPEVLILDISMPRLDGFEVAAELFRAGVPTHLIFLTAHSGPELFEKALAVGARGYVLKDSALLEIVNSIRDVVSGRRYASPALTSYLMERRTRAHGLEQTTPGAKDLSRAEREILKLIAEYKTSSDISELLHISPRTVDTHRANICAKLGLHGKHALMKFAAAHRWELG